MKAITLWQPWATLISAGVKTIETRGWSTDYRGPLAIHAALKRISPELHPEGLVPALWGKVPMRLRKHPRREGGVTLGPDAEMEIPFGCVVATCTLVDVLPIRGWLVNRGPEPKTSHYMISDVGGLGMHVLGVFRTSDGKGICAVNSNAHEHPWVEAHAFEDTSAQLPWGNYTPGRFAWLLGDVVALSEPIPAKGGRRLWNWDGAP